ncbi:biotin/lipoyl-containing protein [Pseudomonadota bacterium]
MAKKLINVMDTSFRDGFQSVFGARVFTKDFLPVIQAAKESGIRHFEFGGGARFQSLFFYCNESAFDMMDAIRKAVGPDVNLQTLARGVNVVGLESQPSDIIDLHAKMFAKHSVTTIRNFDALNDVENLIYSGQCIKKAGLKHEVAVTMMELPPGCEDKGTHTPEFYIKTLKEIIDSGIKFDSVVFKDASGTSVPSKVYETIKQARKLLGKDVHLRFHSHETAGISVIAYKAALDGGADGIDLAMAPVSGGTAQPDIITMWHALRGTEYDLGIDIDKIVKTEEMFREAMKDYFMPPEAKAIDPMIVFSPMPGGALTANTQMMRDNGILDKFPEVIKAMKEVVIKGGFGTSVTPVSQFYFQQAFNNVMFGSWKKIADGYGKMVLGYFGKTPVKPDVKIIKIASEQLGLKLTTRSPRELNDEDPTKGIEAVKKILESKGIEVTDENIFIIATCKEKGINYLQGKGTIGVRKKAKPEKSGADSLVDGYTVTVNGKEYSVKLEGDKAVVNGKNYDIGVKEGVKDTSSCPPTEQEQTQQVKSGEPITIGMPGNVLRIEVKEGDSVYEGDVLLVLEAMKMETEIKAHKSGTITSVNVQEGEKVKSGQTLLTIS